MLLRISILLLLFPFISVGQKQGQELVDSLVAALPDAQIDSHRIEILNDLAFAYSTIDPDEGVSCGKQSLELSEMLGWKESMATALAGVGVNYAAMANFGEALEFELQSLKLYRELDDHQGEVAMLANIALLYSRSGDFTQALDFSHEALKVSEEIDNKARIAIISENIGTIHFRQKDYPKTRLYYKRAGTLYEELNDKRGIARNKGNMGIVLNEEGAYQQALDYHYDALKINKELGLNRSVQINYVNIGNAYLNLDNYRKAIEYQNMALELSNEYGDEGSIATTLGNIGTVYLQMAEDTVNLEDSRQTNVEKAISYLSESIIKCKKLNYHAPIIEFSNELSTAYAVSGQFEKALHAFKEHTALKDSVFSKENEQRIASLELNREIDLRDKDIQLKDQQLKIKELEINQKRYELGLYLLLIVVLMLIIVFIYRNLRRYRRSLKHLQEENRIQMVRIETQLDAMKNHSKVLKEIAYMQAHDVRGPVTTLLGLTELLKDSDPKNPENSKLVEYIHTVTLKLDDAVKEVVKKENQFRRE